VSAPPELRTTTASPDAVTTSDGDEAAGLGCPLDSSADADSEVVDRVETSVVFAGPADAGVFAGPADAGVFAGPADAGVFDSEESADVLASSSAHATPAGDVTTAPMPNATAKAPTRPTGRNVDHTSATALPAAPRRPDLASVGIQSFLTYATIMS